MRTGQIHIKRVARRTATSTRSFLLKFSLYPYPFLILCIITLFSKKKMARPTRNRQPIYPSFSLIMCRYWAFVRFPVVRVVRGPAPAYQPYARPVEVADMPIMVGEQLISLATYSKY